MSRISIDLLKAHTRTDDIVEDEYLYDCLEAAEAQVLDYIGYSEDELSGIPDEAFPAPLKRAMLMRAASLYEYREDIDNASISPLAGAFKSLAKPYQKMRGGGLMDRLIEKYPPTNEEA